MSVDMSQFQRTPKLFKKHCDFHELNRKYTESDEQLYYVTAITNTPDNSNLMFEVRETNEEVFECGDEKKKIILNNFNEYAWYDKAVNVFSYMGTDGYATGIFNTTDEKVIRRAYKKGLKNHIERVKKAIPAEQKLLQDEIKEVMNKHMTNLLDWKTGIDRLTEILSGMEHLQKIDE